MAGMMDYDKSPIPPEKPGGFASERNPDRAITVDDRGQMNYASAAAEGMVEIVLPAPNGPHAEQRMHVRDFPTTVLREIEQSFKPNMYEKSSPRKSPTDTLRHYIGAARGAQLLDDAGIRRLESLAKQ